MPAPGQSPDRPPEHAVRSTEPAFARAQAAQRRHLEYRVADRAELELRDQAIVELYETGVGVRKIAQRIGISPTTVNSIIAGR